MSNWGPIKLITVDSSGLTTASTNYAAGDQVGAEMTFDAAAPGNAGLTVLVGVGLVDDGDVFGASDIIIFKDTTTEASDNAAASWSDADGAKMVPGGIITLPAPIDFGGVRMTSVSGLWIPVQSGTGHDDLYVDIVTRTANAFFAAADDLHLTLAFVQQS